MLPEFVVDRGSPQAAQLERVVWRIQTRREEVGKRFLMCSCWPDEGKTTVSIQLAQLLAESGSRVLLVDGDVRRPALSHSLGHFGPGLDRFLAEPNFREVHALAPQLDLLSAGPTPELLLSPEGDEARRFAEKVADYDVVLIDSPPLAVCSDALLLAALCDAAVLVISGPGYQGPPESRLIKDLQSVNLSLEGVVLTQAQHGASAALPESLLGKILVWLGLRP